MTARGDVELVVINPIGLPPWPLTLREPYRSLVDCPATSRLGSIAVHHPRFTLFPLIGGDSNPARIAAAVLPLARRLQAMQPFDLVDAQFFFPDGPAAQRVAAALGLPLAIKARGSDIHYWGARPRARAQILAAAQAAAGLLAVSAALRGDMVVLGCPAARIAVHYTGLDHALFKVTPRADAKARLPELLGLTIPGAAAGVPGRADRHQGPAPGYGSAAAIAWRPSGTRGNWSRPRWIAGVGA